MKPKTVKQLGEGVVTELQLSLLRARAQHDPEAKAYLERLMRVSCVKCGRMVLTPKGKKMPCPACQSAMAREQQKAAGGRRDG